jgi:hypothetical protein
MVLGCSKERSLLFRSRRHAWIKGRHCNPSEIDANSNGAATADRTKITNMKNLSLASVLSSASAQSCTMARDEVAKTLTPLIAYLRKRATVCSEGSSQDTLLDLQRVAAATSKCWVKLMSKRKGQP